MEKEKKEPTAWRFVWNNDRFFSSTERQTIEHYTKGAIEHHGRNCGRIESMFDDIPYIVEGKAQIKRD